MGDLAPLIAVIGCDGSGKSTLARDVQAHFAHERPTALAYLGLRSGAMGESIKRWPIVGTQFERYLSNRAAQARDGRAKIPGVPTALVIFVLSLLRKRRFGRVLALRRSGVMVVTDRYPQTEFPGFYDGPGLSAARADSALVAYFVAKERAIYDWMASFVPTLVIRLNVDVDTAHARKPDHKREMLATKVAVTPRLKFNGAPIVDLDATMPYAEELVLARAAVDQALA